MRSILAVLVVLCVGFIPVTTMAAGAGNQPRDWIAAPKGTVAGLLYFNLTGGRDTYVDGKHVAHSDLDGYSGMFRAVTYFDVCGFTADVNILLPFANMELSTGGVETNTSGIGDPGVVGTFWLIDDKLAKRYLALAQYLFIPVGEYQNYGSLSVGSNRWQGKTAINFTQGFEVFPKHDFYVEAGFGIDYYGENDDYGVEHHDMSQDPVYTVDAHISYDLTTDWWVALDYCGVWGGAKSWGYYHNQGGLNTQSAGASVSYMLTPSTNVLLQYSKDISVRNGILSDNILLRISHAIDFNALLD